MYYHQSKIFFLLVLGLEVTKQDLESEKRKNIGLLEQLKDRDRKLKSKSLMQNF